MKYKIILWGGLGDKSIKGYWHQQDRIYDPEGISPALCKDKADLLIVLKDEETDTDNGEQEG